MVTEFPEKYKILGLKIAIIARKLVIRKRFLLRKSI